MERRFRQKLLAFPRLRGFRVVRKREAVPGGVRGEHRERASVDQKLRRRDVHVLEILRQLR